MTDRMAPTLAGQGTPSQAGATIPGLGNETTSELFKLWIHDCAAVGKFGAARRHRLQPVPRGNGKAQTSTVRAFFVCGPEQADASKGREFTTLMSHLRL